MNKGRRRLFHSLTALSISIGLIVLIIDLRSYWVADRLGWRSSSVETTHGEFHFSYMSYTPGSGYAPGTGWAYSTSAPRGHKAKSLWGVQPALAEYGFAYTIITDPRFRSFHMMVPLWFIALIFAILPASWLSRYRRPWRRERRRAAGLCVRCGYDIRATPERCPECGESTLIETSGED